MGVGIFLLVLLVIVVCVLGAAVYAIAARLRQKQLDPRGNQLEQSPAQEREPRPQHLEVDSEQHRHFAGRR